ncbi:MAG: DUF362 domain-containing protein [Armatimonadota bacterium]
MRRRDRGSSIPAPSVASFRTRSGEEGLHLHFEPCNQCGRCLQVAPEGSLKIDPVNFQSFQQAMAYAVESVLITFDRDKQVFINIGTQITPVCDCFGFTGPAILPDIGIFGGNDPCAVDTACLDAMKSKELILEKRAVLHGGPA